MNALMSKMTGEELLLLTVLNGGEMFDAVEAELDHRARTARPPRIRLGGRDLVARQPAARPIPQEAVAA